METPGRFELGSLHLSPGEGTRAEVTVAVAPIKVGSEEYAVGDVPVTIDIARMIGGGYSLRLRGEAGVYGSCLRCLDKITFERVIDVREVDRPDEEDADDNDLRSPYVDGDLLALADWLRDTIVLDLPATMSPPTDAGGRCMQCSRTLVDLGAPAPPEPGDEPPADPRWAKLRELDLGDSAGEE